MQMLLDPPVLTKAITEFGNTLSSLSIPTYKLRMKKLFLEALKSNWIRQGRVVRGNYSQITHITSSTM